MDWIAENLGIGREQLAALGTVLVVVSIFMVVASLLLIPWVLLKLPADYLTRGDQPFAWQRRHPLLRWTLVAAKNLLGLILVAAGLIMLVVPGQGLVTIFVGIMLTDLPGKRKLERKILGNRHVLRWINRLRKRAGKAPLETE